MNLCVPSRLCGERKREVNRRGAKSAESTVQGFNARIRSGNSLPIPLEWSTGMERGGALLVSTGLLLEMGFFAVFGGMGFLASAVLQAESRGCESLGWSESDQRRPRLSHYGLSAQ